MPIVGASPSSPVELACDFARRLDRAPHLRKVAAARTRLAEAPRLRVNGAVDVFVSYRRDDTGGRAGRLADALASHFGRRHVFQDVTTVAPGAPFDDQVDLAIAASDVVLVVIGRTWAGIDPDDPGGRRIDRPDDFVRHEVRAALRRGGVVVPVLVDGAELPSEATLPDDLRPLVRRQAARLRDESWHRDVDTLVRQLTHGSGDTTTGRRRTALLGALVAALLAITTTVALLARRADDPTDDQPTGCEPLDDTWTTLSDLAGPSTVTAEDVEHQLGVAPRTVAWTAADGEFLVQVTVAVTNDTDPIDGSVDDEVYVSYTDVASLAVDGVQTTDLRCVAVDGVQQLAPGRTVLVTLRYATTQDPAGAPIVIDMQGGDVLPVVAA